MFAPSKSLTLYKDFGKDVKDMLTKSYSEPQKWKVESKFKGPKDMLFVNPTATSDGKFSADVEFIPSYYDAALKVNVNPALDSAKLTATYKHADHTLEAVLNTKGDYELSHEALLHHHVSSHTKLVKDAVELGVGASVAPNCQVGCGARYLFGDKKDCEWSMSCRYAEGGRMIAVRTDRLQSYTTSFVAPLPSLQHRVFVGGEVVCGSGRECAWTAGAETDCLVFKGNRVKARVNHKKEWAVAYIARLADKWTAAVSFDKNMKPGVVFTHS